MVLRDFVKYEHPRIVIDRYILRIMQEIKWDHQKTILRFSRFWVFLMVSGRPVPLFFELQTDSREHLAAPYGMKYEYLVTKNPRGHLNSG